jgi:uncharacterized protein DUF3558
MRRDLVIALALLLVGCSPVASNSEPPLSTSRHVDLNGVDPCGLVSDEFVRLAGLDSGPAPETHPTFQSPSCRFHSTVRNTELTVTVVPTIGFERFEPSGRTGEAKSRTVQGARALEFPSAGRCAVVVEVANGQVLHVEFRDASGRPVTEEVVCQLALDLAGAAMRTLLAR